MKTFLKMSSKKLTHMEEVILAKADTEAEGVNTIPVLDITSYMEAVINNH